MPPILSVLKAMASLICICIASGVNANQPGTDLVLPKFTAEVVRVDEYGMIFFAGHRTFNRLWGIEPDPEELRNLIQGKELKCNIITEYRFSRKRFKELDCYLRELSRSGYHPSLAEYLLKQGHAREICSQTENAFKTCKTAQKP